MTSVTVHRKIAPKYANDIKVNEDVGSILENPEETWSSLSPKLHKVADLVSSKDYGKSTILGSGEGFMEPFREAVGVYGSLYSSSDWCMIDRSNNTHKLNSTPFDFRENEREDPSFVQKLTVEKGKKIIVIGDVHSGLQSVVQIIDNLVHEGVISDDLRISPGYILIFLGDLLDRGGLGLDIIHIVFRMKVLNFDRLYYINANHEDQSMYDKYGFGDEMRLQLPNENDQNLVHNLLTYLPSAIFAFFEETGKWIQFNHGGIEPTYDPKVFMESEFDFQFFDFDFTEGKGLEKAGLRWNDFNGNIESIGRSSRGGDVVEYGMIPTDFYLESNNLQGIIRGHQDFMHCAILTKFEGEDRDFKGIDDVGMIYPHDEHWKSYNYDTEWEKISIGDAFKDYSVFTTSTAVRARDLGYHTYLEVSSSESEIRKAQSTLKNHKGNFKAFADELGFSNEFDFILKAEYGEYKHVGFEKYKTWKTSIAELKGAEKEHGYQLYSWLVLDSYKFIRP